MAAFLTHEQASAIGTALSPVTVAPGAVDRTNARERIRLLSSMSRGNPGIGKQSEGWDANMKKLPSRGGSYSGLGDVIRARNSWLWCARSRRRRQNHQSIIHAVRAHFFKRGQRVGAVGPVSGIARKNRESACESDAIIDSASKTSRSDPPPPVRAVDRSSLPHGESSGAITETHCPVQRPWLSRPCRDRAARAPLTRARGVRHTTQSCRYLHSESNRHFLTPAHNPPRTHRIL
jgi:hypothetical protein